MTWEYKIFRFDDHNLETMLQQVGQQGWELCHARWITLHDPTVLDDQVECIFKRSGLMSTRMKREAEKSNVGPSKRTCSQCGAVFDVWGFGDVEYCADCDAIL